MNIMYILSFDYDMYNTFMPKNEGNISETFGANLKRCRELLGLTQTQMANELGISLRAYQHYEAGTREPSLATLSKLTEILDVSIDALLGIRDVIASDEFREFLLAHPKFQSRLSDRPSR